MKAFFFQKINILHQFVIFPNFEIFRIAKISQLRSKRQFQEIISFDTHPTENLSPLPILKKNQAFFQKKPNLPTYLRELTISVAFWGKFLQFGDENSQNQNLGCPDNGK